MEIYEAHRLVYHYTSIEGLEGILSSNSFWATHYKDLNDYTECKLFKDYAARKLLQPFLKAIKEIKKDLTFSKQQLLKRKGIFAIAKHETNALVNAIYNVSFEGIDDKGKYVDPFIVSFCSHKNDDNYTQQNGLLSQWRGYAEGGGVAIVFDTKKLTELMFAEIRTHGYTAHGFGDVVYQGEEEKECEEFGSFIEIIGRHTESYLRGENPKTGHYFGKFVANATRYKHRAFKEEREVRLMFSPVTEDFMKLEGETEEDFPSGSMKPVLTRDRAGKEIKYISVFGTKRLPVKKVIVGPCADPKGNLERVKKIVGERAPVILSDTPFIP
ncbi:hypothetical protein GCM10011332_26130 [Terasakiella brassicae]|uniref:DUF2971 domain-containing protein n=1 Tax=Terasakiella brassicae TaxID=1634917 RepID=A0A917FDI7_9PROT|nr:DUF2971 domain-containing protein [Terasakiella brassicae]GGF70917.1 hypothetical protein GCM10011332_26130 [Terasakiella brassicae]